MNLLLTSVGRRSYLIEYFKESLKGIGEVHAANSECTYATSLADKFIKTPLIYDGNYIQFILDYCIRNNIRAIVSLFDVDLPILARHKDHFEGIGIKVIVSDEEVITICNDKWSTYNFLNSHKFSTPKSFIQLDACEKALAQKEIAFPLIIKPRWGMGSIGIFEADNGEELKVLYRKTLLAIQRSYLRFESLVDLENCVIIQEKLEGQEYGLDVFNDLEKNYVCTIPKIKIAMRAGETDIAKIIENEKLEAIGKDLSKNLGHIANLDVDVFLVDGEFHILEMNARFGGQYPFSHAAGVDFPTMIIDFVSGKKISRTYEIKRNATFCKDMEIREFA